MDWPSMSRLEPNRTSLGDPQAEGGCAQSLKYPPALRHSHGGVATFEALVNSMPRRVKAVLDNDGGHTKY